MKVKTLRCKYPIIDMKKNKFSPSYSEIFDGKQLSRQSLGNIMRELDVNSNDTRDIMPDDPKQIMKNLGGHKRGNAHHYNSIDITGNIGFITQQPNLSSQISISKDNI